MSKQPKALEFADALEWGSDYPSTLVEVAAELRRLHSVNADLLEALKTLMNFLPDATDMRDVGWGDVYVARACAAHEKARAAIAKAEEA